MWFNKKKQILPTEAELPQGQEPKLDINSPTWKYVVLWAEGELTAARERNDSPALDVTKTAVTRGKIRTLKDLLELPEAGNTALGILSYRQAGEVTND